LHKSANVRQEHPKERPWVQIENATTEELIAQIGKCPSGALSYRLNKKEK
jgi:uncharacterized Fe-S cluster protein YjdI